MAEANRQFRLPFDNSYLWRAKGRKNYIAQFKKLGFTDICECFITSNDVRKPGNKQKRRNANQYECTECHCLVWPFAYIYECDECTEPALADHFPVKRSEHFLCDDCLSDFAAKNC